MSLDLDTIVRLALMVAFAQLFRTVLRHRPWRRLSRFWRS